MLVVSYADFFANPSQYKNEAALSGLKILPEVDADALLAERRMSESIC